MGRNKAPTTIRSLLQKRLETMRVLDSYAPDADASEWAQVSGFAQDAALLAAEASGRDPVKLLKVVGPYLLWCQFEHGLELQADIVFTTPFIDRYCAQWSATTAATYRSALLVVAAVLSSDNDRSALMPISRKVLEPPYAAGELYNYRTWARGQRTAILRRRAKLVLALGAGAGLRPGELLGVKGRDVSAKHSGVRISVRGREVPVLASWEDWVAAAAADTEEDLYLWAPRSGAIHKNTLWDFTSRSGGAAPSVSRLRTTWMCSHLRVGTPMKSLFEAGGIERLDNLHHYLAYINPPDREDYRRQLRMEAHS